MEQEQKHKFFLNRIGNRNGNTKETETGKLFETDGTNQKLKLIRNRTKKRTGSTGIQNQEQEQKGKFGNFLNWNRNIKQNESRKRNLNLTSKETVKRTVKKT